MDCLEQPKQREMDIIFGTWNVRSPYRAGSLTTVAGEIEKYKCIRFSVSTDQMGQEWQ
jgi:hypothetical protein